MKPRVTAVVVHYGPLFQTIRCMRALARVRHPDLSIVLVDNSGLGARLGVLLPKQVHPMRILSMGGNAGYAPAVNRGLGEALRRGARYAWLLNAEPEPGSLMPLVAEMERHSRTGIAGSRLHDDREPRRIWHAGGAINMRTGLTRSIGNGMRDTGQFGKRARMDYVAGTSMLVRSTVLRKVGLLDARFVMYYEETDLCVRARKAGWDVVYCPGSRVRHNVAAREEGGDLRWLYHLTRNRFYFLLKHNRRALPSAMIRTLKWPLGSCLVRGRLDGVWHTFRGCLSFLRLAVAG
jgi:GT2 family glycosyltransferase